VKFYTQARLDALEAEKAGDKGEGPSRLPDAKKDNVRSTAVVVLKIDRSICGHERWNAFPTAGLAEVEEDCRGKSG
jgi:hypothetical protein